MRKFQFILKMREYGCSEDCIAAAIEFREREQAQGIDRPWEAYLPKCQLEAEEKELKKK